MTNSAPSASIPFFSLVTWRSDIPNSSAAFFRVIALLMYRSITWYFLICP